jgi:excisionase family DNA binding protein
MALYLRTKAAAAMLGLSTSRLYDLMRDGTLIEGLHFSRPRGMHPRFNAELLERYLTNTDGAARRVFDARTKGRQGCKVNLQAVA